MTIARTVRQKVSRIYTLLYRRYGPQHWWPARTPFEVMIGAILTQNTAWVNVERAIVGMRQAHLLDPRAIAAVRTVDLEAAIRPAGYYRVKAVRIKRFVRYLNETYGGSLDHMRRVRLSPLRAQLLTVHGIGPETADSILLYALGKPSFVVDAYTRRVFFRHGLISRDVSYDDIKRMCEDSLCGRRRLFNEYHALIVRVGKEHCKPTPRCAECPLAGMAKRKRWN